MNRMTHKEAAAFAGCSVSTLKRYQCGFCEQSALDMLRYGCGAIWGPKCDPRERDWPPKTRKAA